MNVDLYSNVTVPFAHNNEYIYRTGEITYHYSLAEGYSYPEFMFTSSASATIPFVVEYHIQGVTFSDSGNYQVLLYGHLPSEGRFTLVVRRKL